MGIVEISNLNHAGVEVFSRLTEPQLRMRKEEDMGLFIAESPKVIRTALKTGHEPVALMCEKRHIEGDARDIVAACGDIPIYTGSREVLSELTGYVLTRGVLCAMRRPAMRPLEEVCGNARRIAVLYGIVDSTNVGAIFRSAAAMGIGGVVLGGGSCDPLNRRVVRVSMGGVFTVPWCWADGRVEILKEHGFRTAAMALRDDSTGLDDMRLKAEQRLAIILGNEGDGLPKAIIEAADYVVKIPMAREMDSLNVAAAAAVAFWELRS